MKLETNTQEAAKKFRWSFWQIRINLQQINMKLLTNPHEIDDTLIHTRLMTNPHKDGDKSMLGLSPSDQATCSFWRIHFKSLSNSFAVSDVSICSLCRYHTQLLTKSFTASLQINMLLLNNPSNALQYYKISQWWAQIFEYSNIWIKWPLNIICIRIRAISPIQIYSNIHS